MKRLAWLLLAPALFAQPRLQNARLETRAVSGSLDGTFRSILTAQTAPIWVGYAAPQIAGDRTMCCWNSNNGMQYQGCVLEPQSGNTTFPPPTGTVKLEGATEFFVFFRIENKQVEKIRSFSTDCNIDAGGLPFIWLTGVTPSQSIALLESQVPLSDSKGSDAKAERKLANGAISAIAMHRDPAADAALDRLSAATRTEETRRQAAFWMGNARGRHGYQSLQRILRDDPSDHVREHAVFALTQSKEPEAIPAIARIAHDDKSAHVRSQALFWLAQTAGRQISETAIRQAIENDPETEVKKKAVFALTQMKNGDGVPLLIEIARNNRNAVVRKEAMFWLGQSKDQRATQFFEDLLVKR
jgi:hypothetical protein